MRRHIIDIVNSAELLARIAPEPGKMGGKPVIRGRRITAGMVLTMLAQGATREDVLQHTRCSNRRILTPASCMPHG